MKSARFGSALAAVAGLALGAAAASMAPAPAQAQAETPRATQPPRSPKIKKSTRAVDRRTRSNAWTWNGNMPRFEKLGVKKCKRLSAKRRAVRRARKLGHA